MFEVNVNSQKYKNRFNFKRRVSLVKVRIVKNWDVFIKYILNVNIQAAASIAVSKQHVSLYC